MLIRGFLIVMGCLALAGCSTPPPPPPPHPPSRTAVVCKTDMYGHQTCVRRTVSVY